MNRHANRAASALLSIGSLILPAVATAVTPQDESAATRFTDRAQVNIVNVDVVVSDGKEPLATGLRATDFELLVDGQSVPITHFFAPSEDGFTPPNVTGTRESESFGEPSAAGQGRYLVIFVDNRGGRPLIRDEALRELGAELGSYLAGGWRVMLVSQTDEIRVLHRFGDDPGELAGRLTELAGTTVGGSSLVTERAEILRAIDRTSFTVAEKDRFSTNLGVDPAIPGLQNEARSLLQRTRNYADGMLHDLRERLALMTQFQASLAGLSGNKAMLYIGEGFDTRPGEDLFRIWEQRYPDLGEEMFFSSDGETSRYRIDEELNELVSQANASGVTCYTLYTAGSERFSSLSAKSSGAAGASTIATSGRRAIEDSLNILASATGGLALSPGGDLGAAIAGLPAEIGTYYSLGFEPIDRDDQTTHRIEVKVKREGLGVRHREFYRFKSADELMSELTYAALLFEPGANPLEAAISVRGIEERERGRFEVSVAVTVPLAKLALVPSRGTHVGRVKVFFAVQDRRGWASAVRSQSFPVHIPNASLLTALGQDATFSWNLLARSGPQELAVTLRDDLGEIASAIRLEFDIPVSKD
jgi:VWFA-related protein